jgi:PIN domain nuclease of toxin-antitoxin system
VTVAKSKFDHRAPLDWMVVRELRFTMLGYKDPADRFLAAAAKVYDRTLITADERLLMIPGLKHWQTRKP